MMCSDIGEERVAVIVTNRGALAGTEVGLGCVYIFSRTLLIMLFFVFREQYIKSVANE